MVFVPENLNISHLIGTLKFGGAERQLINLINNLDIESKHLIVLSEQKNHDFYPLLKHQISCHFMPINLRYFYITIFKIAKYLRENRINILQTHMFWANFYGVIAGKIAGVPAIVTTEHGKNPWKKKWHFFIERRIITTFADIRVCVSQDIINNRKQNDRIPEHKLVYIPNAVNIPEIYTKIPNSKIIIGAIGRFIQAKDFATLIEAAAILKKQNIDFEIFILGDGELRVELESLKNALNLQLEVKMPGFQNDIDKWLRMFDIFVISSIREGQPLVLLEAMANGLPIVATKVGGIPDTLKNGEEGILVEPRDPEKLSSAIMKLIKYENLRIKYGKNARERVKNNFSIKEVCQQYVEFYTKILSDKNMKM